MPLIRLFLAILHKDYNQPALNLYNNDCIRWKLKINISKSTVMVFSKDRLGNYNFTLNDDIIEVVNVYQYLGILFSKNGIFFAAKTNLASQAGKAIFCLIKQARSLLPYKFYVLGQIGLSKQCRPRSDCFSRSSLIRVYTVCHSISIFWMH